MSRPRKSEDTRRRLLDTGVAVLLERGYHGTGIKEVLDRVRVPKGSFYNYFGSKEAFGAEIIRHYCKGLGEQLAVALGNSRSDGLAGLKKHFRQAIRSCQDDRCGCLAGNLGAELGDSSEVCRAALAEAMNNTQEHFRRAIKRAQEQGTVRADLEAGELAGFVLNAWQGALIRMKVEASVAPLRQFVSLVLDDFLLPERGK